MKLVPQLISLYDLIFNPEIEHIILLLILYILLLLKVLHFSYLEKLKLVLKLIFFNVSFNSSVHTNGLVLFLVKSLIFTE